MQQEQPSAISKPAPPRASSVMTAFPLAIAYVAIPLSSALNRFAGSGSEVSPFVPWLFLAGVGAIWSMLFRRSGVRVKKRFIFEAIMFLVLVVILFTNREILLWQMQKILPVAFEMVPIGMLGFCLLWAMTFGVPDRAAFQRYGAVLAMFCIADLAVEATAYQAVPMARWIGQGDMLAGLLLVSLCASLRPGENHGGVFEPDQGKHIWRALILLGLAACLSRTGLFAAGWILLFFGRGTRPVRILISLTYFLLIGVTFLLPTTVSDGARYIDYWLWAKSVSLFIQEPLLLVAGLPMGEALPFAIPVELAAIWERATSSLAAMGVYLPQVQSFWLRLILGWGAIVPLCGLIALFIGLSHRPTRLGAGLAAALFTQGMSTPLFYNPTLGVIMGLALILALSKSAPLDNVKIDHPKPAPNSDPETDPVKEWDMRPL